MHGKKKFMKSNVYIFSHLIHYYCTCVHGNVRRLMKKKI